MHICVCNFLLVFGVEVLIWQVKSTKTSQKYAKKTARRCRFFVFKRVVFCCFAMVFQQATFLTAIFVAQNLPSATLSRAFCCSFVNRQAIWLCLFCLLRAGVFCSVGAGFALFFATPLPFGRLGKSMFPSKVCRRSVVFFVCGVFSRKMCCKRFLLMRFCTTLFALFHVWKQFNVAFVNVDVSGDKKACFLQVVLCKRVLQCTAYCKTQGDEKPFSQRCVCDIMFFEVITIHTGKMR